MYVSKKRRENGQKNVQSQAVSLAYQLLNARGKYIELGTGESGKAMNALTAKLRQRLKDGMSKDDIMTDKEVLEAVKHGEDQLSKKK